MHHNKGCQFELCIRKSVSLLVRLTFATMNQENELLRDESGEELYETRVIKTDKGQEPIRIDKFLMNRIEGATRNKIQQALEAGLITVNGHQVKANYKVKAFEELIIYSTDYKQASRNGGTPWERKLYGHIAERDGLLSEATESGG
jgi:ribosomal 50S subunit-recycling heat shock protein